MLVDFSMLGAALVAGLFSSVSPCVVAAVPLTVGFVGGGATDGHAAIRLTLAFLSGMVVALVALGLAAAQLGVFFGTLGPLWTVFCGAVIAVVGVWFFFRSGGMGASAMHGWAHARLRGSGTFGALALGALTGTVMTPCATPVLAAALTLAGSGSAFEGTTLAGAMMLLAYGVGRSPLLLFAGIAPQHLGGLMKRLGAADRFMPGQRVFSAIMVAAGIWLILQSGILPQI
ncbi:cytochrome c biogenesis CcdA family protein [Phaeovulum sp.]|uniref:cytochrome c biogenesis CcdA family protein n=1 Tax=Phaeovulum sp. TaxID=2934796 RepID=UPI00356301D2